ncbi:unnamed protein product [Polarella glacialis]|uniref:Uncharacterized protein n=1 Tax=Polarella glacialis TaxID=89957 RepID=A0A813EIB0_POLGL|nr:unnamed protein product [Polarella glacialis]
MAEFHKIEFASLVAAVRNVMAIRATNQTRKPDFKMDKHRYDLWQCIIQDLLSAIPNALDQMCYKVICSYLVVQAQAAEVEGVLSRRSRVRQVLGPDVGIELQSQYVQAQLCAPLEPSKDYKVLVDSVTTAWLLKNRRMPKRDRHQTARARVVRNDKGTKGLRPCKKRKSSEMHPGGAGGKLVEGSSLVLSASTEQDNLDDDDLIFVEPVVIGPEVATGPPTQMASSSTSSSSNQPAPNAISVAKGRGARARGGGRGK